MTKPPRIPGTPNGVERAQVPVQVPVIHKLVRHVYLNFQMMYGTQEDLLPEMSVTASNDDTKPRVLSIQVPGEIHLFVINEEQRKALVQALTGGVLLPDELRHEVPGPTPLGP